MEKHLDKCIEIFSVELAGRGKRFDEDLYEKNTRADKEKDKINHIDALNANTELILLTYKTKAEVRELTESWLADHDPVYDFVSEDGIRHLRCGLQITKL